LPSFKGSSFAAFSRTLAAIIMKVISIIFIIIIFLTFAGYSQKLDANKEIRIVRIDSNICRNLYLVVFKSDNLSNELRILIVDKTELLKTNRSMFNVDHKYIVKLRPIPDFTTNIKYSCLTRFENGSSVFIDNIMIWNKQKGIYPYEFDKIN
jgi:archaellum component FlaF (FlaF/FlaG flagellin family)